MTRFNKALATVVATFALQAHAVVLTKSMILDGVSLDYVVVLPPNFDASQPHPAVLAFPPGEQDMAMIDFTLEANYRTEAEKRGYLVFLPAIPDGQIPGAGTDARLPAFILKLLDDYKVSDGKFNVAGMSNGGLSAFRLAAGSPQYFLSVTGLPGFLQHPEPAQLAALGTLCVHLFAGEFDEGWPGQAREQAAMLKASRHHVTFSLERGEGHVMQTLAGAGAARLFDQFDAARRGQCAE